MRRWKVVGVAALGATGLVGSAAVAGSALQPPADGRDLGGQVRLGPAPPEPGGAATPAPPVRPATEQGARPESVTPPAPPAPRVETAVPQPVPPPEPRRVAPDSPDSPDSADSPD